MFENFDSKDWCIRYDQVYGYFYRRVNSRSDVEDLTMETLEIFYTTQKKIDNINAFIWGIARNKMLEYIRYKGKNQFQELLPWQDDHLEIGDLQELQNNWLENYRSTEYLAKIERLKECIKNQLSDLDQQIIDLCITQDFKSLEVAKTLNLSAQNIRQRLSRALRKLRDKCKQIWLDQLPSHI